MQIDSVPRPDRAARPSNIEPDEGTDPHPEGDAPRPHVSDSAVQRDAEKVILERLSRLLGVTVARRAFALPSGARVEVDGASADLSVLLEVFVRQGALKGGQQKKVCQGALKLITRGRHSRGRPTSATPASRPTAIIAT